MSGSLNLCQFIGNLGADPESRSLNNGGEVCNMRIACSEQWKDRDGNRQERTEWVNIVIWIPGLIKVCKDYLRKGSKVYVAGKLQTRKWTDQSGNDRYNTEVVLQGPSAQLILLDGRRDGGGGGGNQSRGDQFSGGGQTSGTRPQPAAFDNDLDDDVPF